MWRDQIEIIFGEKPEAPSVSTASYFGMLRTVRNSLTSRSPKNPLVARRSLEGGFSHHAGDTRRRPYWSKKKGERRHWYKNSKVISLFAIRGSHQKTATDLSFSQLLLVFRRLEAAGKIREKVKMFQNAEWTNSEQQNRLLRNRLFICLSSPFFSPPSSWRDRGGKDKILTDRQHKFQKEEEEEEKGNSSISSGVHLPYRLVVSRSEEGDVPSLFTASSWLGLTGCCNCLILLFARPLTPPLTHHNFPQRKTFN